MAIGRTRGVPQGSGLGPVASFKVQGWGPWYTSGFTVWARPSKSGLERAFNTYYRLPSIFHCVSGSKTRLFGLSESETMYTAIQSSVTNKLPISVYESFCGVLFFILIFILFEMPTLPNTAHHSDNGAISKKGDKVVVSLSTLSQKIGTEPVPTFFVRLFSCIVLSCCITPALTTIA